MITSCQHRSDGTCSEGPAEGTKIQDTIQRIASIAINIFALAAGLRMWSSAEGAFAFLAFMIILLSVVALEFNVTAILGKKERG